MIVHLFLERHKYQRYTIEAVFKISEQNLMNVSQILHGTITRHHISGEKVVDNFNSF